MTRHNRWTLRRDAAIGWTAVALTLMVGVAPAMAQRINVKSATPSAGEQGSVDLQVTIAGSGFGPGAQAVMVHHGTGMAQEWVSPSAIVLQDVTPSRDERFGASVLVGNLTSSGSGALDVVAIAQTTPVAELFRGPLLSTGQTSDPLLRPPVIAGWRRGWWTRPPAVADFNGDGLTDFAFGAPHAPDDLTCDPIGAVPVFLATCGEQTGTTGWESLLLTAPDPMPATFGWSVAAVTGSDLLLVAEKLRDVAGRVRAGQIYIYRVQP